MNFEDFKIFLNPSDLYTFGTIGIVLITLYFFIGRLIKRSRMSNDQKRRFITNLRTFFLIILVGSIFILWATELYQFVISVAALMAGFAIAGKELFLCFAGTFYKTFTRPFSVGDRIEIKGFRGDVVDIGLLSTQLLEVGPKDYTQQLTGRMITIPNSIYLSNSVFNETDAVTEGRDFVLHIFKVPINNDEHWEKNKNILLKAANDSCQKYIEPATVFFEKFAKKRQVDVPVIEPRINIKFDGHAQIILIVRITVPVERKGTMEQEIINDYLRKSH